MVFGTNRNRPWDKPGPVHGTYRPLSLEFHSKNAILSRLSLGRVGVRPWDDCPSRAVRKMFECFLFIGFFFSPPNHQAALKGTNLRGQTKPKRRFSQIFADFCRFSPFPGKRGLWERQSFAENRCFSQETAENRRNPQKTADWRLSPWTNP